MSIRINNNITFIHVAKNSGTSITRVITEHLNTEFSGATHDKWQDLPNSWRDRGFAVIRDSYDRAVSYYLFGQRKTLRRLGFTRNSKQTQQQLKQELEKYEQGFEWWVINCFHPTEFSQILYLPENLDAIRLLLFENIDNDWKKLCLDEGWPDLHLSEHNRNPDTSIPYTQYHTEKTLSCIKDRFYKDIELHEKLLTRLPQDRR